MHEQPASVLAHIATTLLASHKVLALARNTPFHTPLASRDLREAVYLGYLPWSARLPDHIFENSWQLLSQHPENGVQSDLLQDALRAMAGEFIDPLHGNLHVKQQKFGAWQQSVVSRISGLPVLAAAHVLEQPRAWLTSSGEKAWSWDAPPNWADKNLPLISPYDAAVEDYLGREGLHETHLHLNGSTHAENCWLRALYRPKQETRDFSIKWHDRSSVDATRVRELALAANPEMSPVELYRQLVAAGRLRLWLVAAASGALPSDRRLPYDYDELAVDSQPEKSPPDPAESRLQLSARSCVADELRWMQMLLQRLETRPSTIIERMLHVYLLLQNQYYRLLVQSEEQFGFDQFQKLTYTELREPAEADYLPRFRAMHGKQEISRTTYLEGRFAPKNTLRKNHDLLKSILGAYWHYLNYDGTHDGRTMPPILRLDQLLTKLETYFHHKSAPNRSHHRLTLVAHFIKKSWSHKKQPGPYRYYKQRKELEHSANVLIETLERWPRLRVWVRGIDAAANELHAPPEIFASCYRVCRHAGLTHRSYHVGEDFPHLLSGLRTMYEALDLLDLRDGDRIGHGTAMGISPQLWLERMPGQVVVKKGDWMLDLLAAWRLLRTAPEATAAVAASRVAIDLAKCAGEIFHKDISCTELEAVMSLRHLNVRYMHAALEPGWSPEITPLSDIWQAEARRVADMRDKRPDQFKLLWEWLSDEKLWERSESLISVEAAYFDAATYILIQQALMREVARRKVVIETLPSSNVRISQYRRFSEHHALRWMRVPGFMQENDPEIMVSLGSDDPGIFAGDLNGEFYQLYAALRNQGMSDQTALFHLATINERGRVYRFHDPLFG